MNPEDNPSKRFDPSPLQSTVIALPLWARMRSNPTGIQPVLIVLHNGYPSAAAAAKRVSDMLDEVLAEEQQQGEGIVKNRPISQYVVARLTPKSIRALAARDRNAESENKLRAIYQIWPDFEVRPLMDRSIATVKADAAAKTFAAEGTGIVWAVVDSGIDETHPHFKGRKTLVLDSPLKHRDFTFEKKGAKIDGFGHGTHVAGIIAGDSTGFGAENPTAIRAMRDENDDTSYLTLTDRTFVGMAPKCKLVSYKVLDDEGQGETTSIIAALQDIQKVNRFGDKLKIHGVNLSVGYPIDPTWFACGQSPLCVEVTRLVNSGVVVVIAAGNTGYGFHQDRDGVSVAGGQGQTINDPGNTEAGITVGSTHRDMPHVYGVSYFSSKGPTGDGRAKPDLIAPGEKILSCAAGKARAKIADKLEQKPASEPPKVHYVEDSGTSMSAAHVSGVIAAFLSIRNEFIGRPYDVKRIFTSTATDLGRVADFQGSGLIDVMRAIQSV